MDGGVEEKKKSVWNNKENDSFMWLNPNKKKIEYVKKNILK